MKKVFLFVTAIGFIVNGCAATIHDVQKPAPSWMDKTILPEENFIYSIGHSRPRKTAKEARDEALAGATEEFVKYCKVDVQSFDRSIEIYSKKEGKEFHSLDIGTQSIIRARAFVSRAIPEDWYIRKQKKGYIASVLLKVPKEEFDRIVNEKNIKLSLDILFYYEDEDNKMQPLTDGSVLKSGDGFAIFLRPSDSSYIYVYQVDALGKTFRLFPNADFRTGNNPLPLGDELWIPNERELFILDDTTGKEFFYIFASLDRIEEFEGDRGITLEKMDINRVIDIKKMGIAGVRDKRYTGKIVPPKQTQQVAEVKKKLQAEGGICL